MVPGFGLVTAAGPLAWALGGALGATAAGAVAGGVFGALRDIGIEEHHARGYEERVRAGDVLMTALVPTVAEDRVLDILADHGAEDVSFADDTSISQMPVSPEGRAAIAIPVGPGAERDFATTVPASGAPASSSWGDPNRETAAYADSPIGAAATTGAQVDPDIERGQVKQVEGEIRDRAADRTFNPVDDVTAKARKVEGKVQEELGETEETIKRPRP
jgi:uncharacterized protein YjbJ (UPF0337 family)